MIIEHDVLPTLRMVYEMSRCPHEVCVQLYKIHPASTNLPKSVYCVYDDDAKKLYDGLPPEFVSGAGFGFIRFKASVQKKVKATMCQYYAIDTLWMQQAAEILGKNFVHIHRPEMLHFHGCEVP